MFRTELKREDTLLACEKRELVRKIINLEDENEQLKVELEKLREKSSKLEEILKRNSRNSSSPPSRDKKKQKKDYPPKKKGAPKGHKGDTRLDFGAPDKVVNVELPELCPCCKSSLANAEIIGVEVHPVAELAPRPIEVTEYLYRTLKCSNCQAEVKAKTPKNVLPKEHYGPRLQAWLFLQKAYGHQSNQKLVNNCQILGLPISQGTLNNQLKKLNKALSEPVEELKLWNQKQSYVNIDETGWSGRWMWTVATRNTSYLEVRNTRGSKEVKYLLGNDYKGVIVSDRGKCYEPFENRQLCWAHLKRNIQACVESTLPSDNKFGNRMSKYVSEIFHPPDKKMPVKKKMKYFLEYEWKHPPKRTKALKLKEALLEHWDNLWRFEDSDIPPDNNEAERSLRLSVTYRKVCGASRTIWGAEAISKLFTVIQTCNKQGKDIISFISDSLLAKAHQENFPSLVPNPM